MPFPIIPVAAGVLVLVIVLIVVGLASSSKGGDPVATRLEEFASRTVPLTLEEIELSQPFGERVIFPILKGLAGLVTRFTPARAIAAMRLNLDLAGRPNNWGTTEFLGIRTGAAILMAVLSFLLMSMAGQPFEYRVGGVLVGVMMGYLLPAMWLGGKIRRRQADIIRGLPDALDLLTICVEAGLGLDAAMAKLADKWDNEICHAFGRVIHEIRLGKLRRDALREMDRTTGVPDITSFVAAVIQAEQLGVSMAKVMRIQSEQMRIRRRQRAEEKAHQAPVKMLFPLVFLIFPAIYIVLLGPATMIIKEAGFLGGM